MDAVGRELVLRLVCPDRVGIVHAVSGFLAEREVNIAESQQFADSSKGRFFMRVQATLPDGLGLEEVRAGFGPLAESFQMTWGVHDAAARPRIAILVSKLGHCLNDLLYRQRTGALRAEIASIVSNHDDFAPLAASYGIPFHYLPVHRGNRAEQEAELIRIVEADDVELVVLARYMQILSPALCERFAGRAINIHHSFLPSFRGARPYHQAFERGVKLIGATAHYVTADLDEGPIIEQEVERVDHTFSPDELAAVGRDIECVALARAVRWHLDYRVMVNGSTTVVFR